MATAKDRVKIKKKRTKIFRKVRNNNSFGTFFAYLFLLVLFSAIFVTIAGFFVEYILESKFYEEYSKLSTVAEIYEGSKSDDNILQTMMMKEIQQLLQILQILKNQTNQELQQ